MVYLACQHAIKMVVMWYDRVVSSFLNDSSDLTLHMFTHVVETNQHSLHDIYVHGDLYPTQACTHCWLISMHVHDCCRCIVGGFPISC